MGGGECGSRELDRRGRYILVWDQVQTTVDEGREIKNEGGVRLRRSEGSLAVDRKVRVELVGGGVERSGIYCRRGARCSTREQRLLWGSRRVACVVTRQLRKHSRREI